MKKLIEGFSILLLVCFSFFYTDKVINMINEKDPLMEEIVSVHDEYETLPVNAVVDDDTIIPGVKGREIDIDKSYDNMKISGIFREEALVFKDLYPSSSLSQNMDKYIVKGSSTKKEVAILYILNNNYINKVKDIEGITLFINHKDLTIDNINILKDKEIYSYGNSGVYNEEVLTSDNTLISRLSNNKSNYCLTKSKNSDVLDICSSKNMYTVIPSVMGGYYNIKSNLSSGSIILIDNLSDISTSIKYIKSKGYDIVSLSRLLSE